MHKLKVAQADSSILSDQEVLFQTTHYDSPNVDIALAARFVNGVWNGITRWATKKSRYVFIASSSVKQIGDFGFSDEM